MQIVKKTDLLVAELEAISDDHPSICNYCREVLKESAQRLRDLEKIAEYYQQEASRLAGIANRRKEKCKGT